MTSQPLGEGTRARNLLQQLALQSAGWSPDGGDWVRWQTEVRDLITRVYGGGSVRRRDFDSATWFSVGLRFDTEPDASYRAQLDSAFREMLPKAGGFLEALITDLDARSSTVETSERPVPRVFIAHGGQPPVLAKLRDFLVALCCEPIIAEGLPSEDRSVNEQVDWCLERSDCAIVLGTAENLQQDRLYSRPNVYIELGRCQERFPGKTIYLLEDGAKFPSNVAEKVWERFTQDNMERAFIKVVRELEAFGFLRCEVP